MGVTSDQEILAYLDATTRVAVAPRVSAVAEAILARHKGTVAALLFYGSALREPENADRTIDIYVLVQSYRTFHLNGLAAFANWALPPNVYRLETVSEGHPVRTKYTVLSITAFERLSSLRAFQSLVWSRFSQPSAIVYVFDDAIRLRVLRALADAPRTLLRETLGLMPPRFTAREIWLRAMSESYASELRAERPERPIEIYDAAPEHYRRITALILDEHDRVEHDASSWDRLRARTRWAARRILCKTLGAARLFKGAFTFEGGLDYILEKVERHSGVSVAVTPWQRRHPLLAAPVLACRLYRRGAFR